MSAPQDPFAPGSGPQGADGGATADAPSGPPPGYGAPPPAGYGGLSSGSPSYGYGAPPTYGAPPGYGTPQPYGAPSGYGAPSPFGAPGGPQLAGWGSRVAAALLDALLTVVPVVLAGIGAGVTGAGEGLYIALAYVGAFAVLIWNHVRQGNTGQTVGKSALGLRLLREADGQVVGPGLSIGRYFVHFVDALPCYVGYLWPLWDARKQTFADKILKTVVIKA